MSKFEQHEELLAAKEWIEIDETDVRDLQKQSLSQLCGAAMLQKTVARALRDFTHHYRSSKYVIRYRAVHLCFQPLTQLA